MSAFEHGWRELTPQEMERLLGEQRHGRLGLCDGGQPYVVPLSYRYSQGRIFTHGAKRGRRVDIAVANDRACFEVDCWQQGWASVICYGRIALREDVAAKKAFFELMTGAPFTEERLEKMEACIGILEVERMTGRCSQDFSPG